MACSSSRLRGYSECRGCWRRRGRRARELEHHCLGAGLALETVCLLEARPHRRLRGIGLASRVDLALERVQQLRPLGAALNVGRVVPADHAYRYVVLGERTEGLDR